MEVGLAVGDSGEKKPTFLKGTENIIFRKYYSS